MERIVLCLRSLRAYGFLRLEEDVLEDISSEKDFHELPEASLEALFTILRG